MKAHILVGAALLLALGCRAGNQGATTPAQSEETRQQIVDMNQRIDDIDSRLKKIETLLEQALNTPKRPDPEVVYSVPIDGFPSEGPATAKVTIVKAYEYACGYCFKSRETLAQIQTEYGSNVRVVYKPFIVHAEVAVLPALAACAAYKQNKFKTMSTLIWDKGFAERDLGEDKMTELAKEAGLDMERYRADMESEACLNMLKSSVENLSQLGVSGTPTFYINGRPLIGAQPIDAFKEVIDQELAKADKALSGGMKAEDYYRNAVVEAGQKSLD